MNINQNDKIIIKDNLIEELKRLEIEIANEEYYKNLVGTKQTAYCIWEDKFSDDKQKYVTIDLCLEIPIQCVERQ